MPTQKRYVVKVGKSLRKTRVMIYTVKRIINDLHYLRDEDRIIAQSWEEAEEALVGGIASGRFDKSCSIDGRLVEEEEVSDDVMIAALLPMTNEIGRC